MGGGGSAARQQRQAEQAEAQRRAEIAAGQRQVEALYGSPERGRQIEDVIAATRGFLTQDLDRKNAEAQRKTKFAVARSGQTMGSVDVDANRALSEQYLRSALEAERRAQGAGTSLRQADQNSKLNLFSAIQQGLDLTTASRNAGEAMRSNIGQARGEGMQQGIGDAFGLFADAYKRSRERKGERQAELYQYGTAYASNPLVPRGGY